MGFWTDVVIAVPRITWRKLEDLVEEVYYIEGEDELDRRERRELAEQLAQRILTEYVQEYFEESAKAAAQMFRSRRKGQNLLL